MIWQNDVVVNGVSDRHILEYNLPSVGTPVQSPCIHRMAMNSAQG